MNLKNTVNCLNQFLMVIFNLSPEYDGFPHWAKLEIPEESKDQA